MASFVSYTATTTIGRALFNFDAMGARNYVVRGQIRVSVSDSFTATDHASADFYPDIYTNGGAEVNWSAVLQQNETRLSNIEQTLGIITQFASIDFAWQGDIDSIATNTVVNPAEVAAANRSDFNISLITRNDIDWVGLSGGGDDDTLSYTGGAGDVFINSAFLNDTGFGLASASRTTLMHELLHSLGLAHPHSDFVGGVPVITDDYAATRTLGFDKLGFRTATARDMDKEFFTIMSYDDGNLDQESHTPMILDVIALQQAYGEGPGTQTVGTGTSTSGDDTITAGNAGYRVYFDQGGNDTIDLSLLESGAYLHMGTTITGAAHLVGVAMSLGDFDNLTEFGTDPQNLRWFYGEFEDAKGSGSADRLVGNARANHIEGLAGTDKLFGGQGNDVIEGGAGSDLLSGDAGHDRLIGGSGTDSADYLAARARVEVSLNLGGAQNTGGAGNDTLSGIENLQGSNFNDRLTGNAAANVLRGMKGNDVLRGDAGSDTLIGGTGADKLLGGAGKDTFVFDKTALDGVDQILDFSARDDTLRLDNALFTRLAGGGALAAQNYRENSTGTARDANDFILYNTHNGALSYDADGSGPGQAVRFATLYDSTGGHPGASQLAPLDFLIV